MRLFLLAFLWLSALLAGSHQASAQIASGETLTNTARLGWSIGDADFSVDSNSVSLDVLRRTKAEISLLRAFPGSDGLDIPRSGTQCEAADGSLSPISFGGLSGASLSSGTSLKPTVHFRAGEPIFILVADADQNRDPLVEETIKVVVASSGGDEETLVLSESGPDTGEFIGGMPTNDATPPAHNDCQLLLRRGDTLTVHYEDDGDDSDVVEAEALVDPLGFVFDSATGEVIDGVTVTLIDVLTGLPAQVFGDDGVSPYPSTVVTGAQVTDSSGLVYPGIPGSYRFPFAQQGDYRLVVTPPAPYVHPSTATPAQMADLRTPDGSPFDVRTGSYGDVFTLVGPEPLRIDIPVDGPGDGELLLQKSAGSFEAELGDYVRYEVTARNVGAFAATDVDLVDLFPPGFRYVYGSSRLGGGRIDDPEIAPDGGASRYRIDRLDAGEVRTYSYLLTVGAGAISGDADNTVRAIKDDDILSNVARARIRVRDPFFTDAVTLIGRVSVGQCGAQGEREGFEGARIFLEDGRYVVTDADGLYHFEGVEPGTHVVQLDVGTLPDGYEAVACEDNTRRGTRAFSSFVEVQGGAVWRTDFVLKRTAGAEAAEAEAANPSATAEPAGPKDWMADEEPGIALLYPEVGHNPRSPAEKVVIKHLPGQTVELLRNGEPVNPVNFEGQSGGEKDGFVVKRWRGVPLDDGRNAFSVIISDDSGIVETIERDIYFVNTATRAELVKGESSLVADGRQNPVIAVRILDAAGRPVRHGMTGTFTVDSPYLPQVSLDRQQERQLAGMERFQPKWHIEGDEGIARIELQPTTQAGEVRLAFTFRVEDRVYEQELEAWLEPGEQEFVLVGYVAGTTGFNTLERNAEALVEKTEDTAFTDGEVKLFAKGRVLGKWLVTLAIDSEHEDRRGQRRQLLQSIDPGRYYTVYGDQTQQRFDAPTSDRLYLRIERAGFYAMYGDFETGLTETELTRYSRTLTGAKTEYRNDNFEFNGFVADTGLRFRREELQGNGLSGPYQLASRDLVLNSEKVAIEVRDRFRPNILVSREEQTRFIDYDIDANSGTIRFKRPIPSRDSDLNPVFVVVDYETEGFAEQTLNAGGRAAVTLSEGRVEFGGSYIRDSDEAGDTDLFGVDARWRPRADTEIRAEWARSESNSEDFGPGDAEAWLVEAQHHGERVDARAYVREQDGRFGVGQQRGSESGTRRYGLDAQLKVTEQILARLSYTRAEQLVGPASRDALLAEGEYRTGATQLRAGYRMVDDVGRDGAARGSDLVTLGASHAFGKLTLEADTELAIDGSDDSVDYPSRYRLGARYQVGKGISLIAQHEIADGEDFTTSTSRVGVDVEPWAGADLSATLNQQDIRENGARTFASLGLRQSVLIDENWSLDGTFESTGTLSGGIDPGSIVNDGFPAASGGLLGGGTITDDFWAATIGATYRTPTLSWTGRLEHRNGGQDDRWGVTTSILRQTTAGIALAAQANYTGIDNADGSSGESANVRLSGAWRPLGSRWAVLDRLEFDLQDVSDGQLPGPFPGFGNISGGSSKRIVNNLALNYMSGIWTGREGEVREGRTQASLYWGAKYVFDAYDGEDYDGFAQVLAGDIRFDLRDDIDLSLNASVRHVANESVSDTLSYSVGPSVGVSPMPNAWISVGYNIAGYHDEDFSDARYTREGAYVTFRLKLDQLSPEALFGK